MLEFRAAAANNGIEASFLFIIGLPRETRSTIVDTFKLIETSGIDPQQVNFSIITPYPGTALYEEAVARNWISGDWDRFSGFEPVMRTDNLSIEDIVAVADFAAEFVELSTRHRRERNVATNAAIGEFYRRLGDWAKPPRPA